MVQVISSMALYICRNFHMLFLLGGVYLFGGPITKDHNILGSILGYPNMG